MNQRQNEARVDSLASDTTADAEEAAPESGSRRLDDLRTAIEKIELMAENLRMFLLSRN